MNIDTTGDKWTAVRAQLPDDYQEPAWLLPEGLLRGSDEHLAYLTLAYTLSGGREPESFWQAARRTYQAEPELFDPRFLAYADPAALGPRLARQGLARKLPSEATVWQRIGQALVMRAGGSVSKLLADHDYDAAKLRAMLGRSKSTFPVLSGPQTAPRWLYGLATVAERPIQGAGELPVPLSPLVARALRRLNVTAESVPAALFERLAAWERQGAPKEGAPKEGAPKEGAPKVPGTTGTAVSIEAELGE
jgi:hypothetical protein